MRETPVVAVTAGDPSGIGPEVALTAITDSRVLEACRPILIADRSALEPTIERHGFHVAPRYVSTAADARELARTEPATLTVLETGQPSAPVEFGINTKAAGRASYSYVTASIDGAKAGLWDAIATAPISKTAWSLAGIDEPGHTEVYAHAFNAPDYAMLLTSDRINVALVTLHQSLASVASSISVNAILRTIRLTDETLTRLLGRRPRLAVPGLNPHAGESGLMGREEIDIVAPAIQAARAMGFNVEGPLPADTAFTPRALSRYDGHVCLYHDQGLIPFKMLAFEDGVNMTMGLPGLVRTSPDHGVAHDIAGRERANASSMIAAILLAARLSACTRAALPPLVRVNQ